MTTHTFPAVPDALVPRKSYRIRLEGKRNIAQGDTVWIGDVEAAVTDVFRGAEDMMLWVRIGERSGHDRS